MTTHLSMSMFASKEDLQAARISQLEADKAALMEVVRTIERSYWDHDEWCSEVRRSVLFLPDHLRKAAMEADTEEAR